MRYGFPMCAPRRLEPVVTADTRGPRHTPAGNGRRHKAGLLASGSSLFVRLPKGFALSGSWTSARRLQLRGQPRVFHLCSLTLRVEPNNRESEAASIAVMWT